VASEDEVASAAAVVSVVEAVLGDMQAAQAQGATGLVLLEGTVGVHTTLLMTKIIHFASASTK
jgi:hypothetical protein